MIRSTAPKTLGTVLVAGTFLITGLAGCSGSSGVVREKTAQELYDEGARLAGRKKYDEALESFKGAARSYRGADLDADIQIALADTFFSKEEYPAAVEAYNEFLRLHPHNARADYAQFRVALSWHKQMRSADRSQEFARKAAAAYEALLRGYPRSPLLDEGRDGLVAVRRRLAEHELIVADFYRRTEKYQAATGRYELVLRDYADLGYNDQVLYGLGSCYRQLRDTEKAAGYFEQLRREYPQSPLLKKLDATEG